MKNILTIISMLLLFTNCNAQVGKYGTSSKKAIKLYEAARVCYNNIDVRGVRELDCAEKNLNAALEKDPSFMEAHTLLSNVFIDGKRFDEAIAQKKKMMSLGKPFSDVEYFYLASMQMAVGDYQGCKANADRYLRVRNANPDLQDKCYKYIETCEFGVNAMKNPVDFKPVNMGAAINSADPEYYPSITADDQTFLYTRLINDARVRGGKQEDILVSTSVDKHWSNGTAISGNVNTQFNEGAPTFSADGKYVILVGCETGNRGDFEYGADRAGLGSCDLFVSEKTGNEWSKPVNMGNRINTGHFESQPSFSSDGKTLYFIRGIIEYKSQRQTKHQDIYMTEIGEDGNWTVPKKLGANINTPFAEESVQIHPDGQTLYFSSAGHPGMGGLDIYMSRMQADGTWGKAINLGYPINSHNDENSLLVSSKGVVAYFASDREGGFGALDLYEFELPKQFRPITTTFMKGRVYDAETNAPLAAEFQLIDLESGKLVKSAIANRGDGSFMVALPKDKDFGVIAEHDGYLYFSKNYSIEKLAATEDGFVVNIPMNKFRIGDSLVLDNVFFDVGKYDLKPQSLTELNKLLDFLNKNSTLNVELGGHTDSDGDDSDNQKLSENRAKAVYTWLIEKGVDKGRLSYKGYGETRPIEKNDTAAHKAINRRTVITIVE
jgi:outer membrane protein OmpA-like peptidoglycan-associated protein